MTTTLALILVTIGGLLVLLGNPDLVKPDLFQQGFWKSIDISRSVLHPREAQRIHQEVRRHPDSRRVDRVHHWNVHVGGVPEFSSVTNQLRADRS